LARSRQFTLSVSVPYSLKNLDRHYEHTAFQKGAIPCATCDQLRRDRTMGLLLRLPHVARLAIGNDYPVTVFSATAPILAANPVILSGS